MTVSVSAFSIYSVSHFSVFGNTEKWDSFIFSYLNMKSDPQDSLLTAAHMILSH